MESWSDPIEYWKNEDQVEIACYQWIPNKDFKFIYYIGILSLIM